MLEKLQAEWPGILQWAIEGCLEWQAIGLAPPAVVRDTTAEYLDDEDRIGKWLAECCTTESQFKALGKRTADRDGKTLFDTPTGALFAARRQWAEDAEEFVGSQKRFGQALESRGFERKLGGENG